jgi:hypothetical protein
MATFLNRQLPGFVNYRTKEFPRQVGSRVEEVTGM